MNQGSARPPKRRPQHRIQRSELQPGGHRRIDVTKHDQHRLRGRSLRMAGKSSIRVESQPEQSPLPHSKRGPGLILTRPCDSGRIEVKIRRPSRNIALHGHLILAKDSVSPGAFLRLTRNTLTMNFPAASWRTFSNSITSPRAHTGAPTYPISRTASPACCAA
jgi:hypothetical protein